ncbi:hypothetical protein BX666DRAFT_1922017 [Dichotomocladium elegans]|nr:hypothetical protein BX666DRAFT_1922017 [Dichotomocladium elegans]
MHDNSEYTQSSQDPEDHHYQQRRVHPVKDGHAPRSSPAPSILSCTGSAESTTSISSRPLPGSQTQHDEQQLPSPSSSFSTRLLKLRSSRTEPFKRRLPKFDLLSFNELSLRRRRPSEPLLRNTPPPPQLLPLALPRLPSSQSLLTKALPSLPVQSWQSMTSDAVMTAAETLIIGNDQGDSWQTVKQVCARIRDLCMSEDTMNWSRLSMLLDVLEQVGAIVGGIGAADRVLATNRDTLDKLKAHCEDKKQMTQLILGIDALAESWQMEYASMQRPLLLKTELHEKDYYTEVPECIIQWKQQHAEGKKPSLLHRLPDYRSIWPEHIDANSTWFRNYFIGKPYVTLVSISKPTTIISVVCHEDEALYRIIIRTHGMNTEYHCVREDQMMKGANAHRHAMAVACSSRMHLREFKEFSPEATILSGTEKELLRFDEMTVPKHYKFGVLHVQEGQDTEELWFANSELTKEFEQFLGLVGERVELKGYTGYAGGLDTRAGESGEVSYVSKWRNHEIMFHVGPLMPLREHDQQQVHRKRYIGNDIVCLVFVDKHGTFDPSKIRSRFLHVFIVVKQLDDGGDHWRVEVVRSRNVRAFGPMIPSPDQLSSSALRDFLLLKRKRYKQTFPDRNPTYSSFSKVVSAENAALQSDDFAIPTNKARDSLLANMAADLVNHHRMTSFPSIIATSPSKSERPRSSSGSVSSSPLEQIPIPPIPPTPTRSTMLRDFVRRRRRSEGIPTKSQRQQKCA